MSLVKTNKTAVLVIGGFTPDIFANLISHGLVSVARRGVNSSDPVGLDLPKYVNYSNNQMEFSNEFLRLGAVNVATTDGGASLSLLDYYSEQKRKGELYKEEIAQELIAAFAQTSKRFFEAMVEDLANQITAVIISTLLHSPKYSELVRTEDSKKKKEVDYDSDLIIQSSGDQSSKGSMLVLPLNFHVILHSGALMHGYTLDIMFDLMLKQRNESLIWNKVASTVASRIPFALTANVSMSFLSVDQVNPVAFAKNLASAADLIVKSDASLAEITNDLFSDPAGIAVKSMWDELRPRYQALAEKFKERQGFFNSIQCNISDAVTSNALDALVQDVASSNLGYQAKTDKLSADLMQFAEQQKKLNSNFGLCYISGSSSDETFCFHTQSMAAFVIDKINDNTVFNFNFLSLALSSSREEGSFVKTVSRLNALGLNPSSIVGVNSQGRLQIGHSLAETAFVFLMMYSVSASLTLTSFTVLQPDGFTSHFFPDGTTDMPTSIGLPRFNFVPSKVGYRVTEDILAKMREYIFRSLHPGAIKNSVTTLPNEQITLKTDFQLKKEFDLKMDSFLKTIPAKVSGAEKKDGSINEINQDPQKEIKQTATEATETSSSTAVGSEESKSVSQQSESEKVVVADSEKKLAVEPVNIFTESWLQSKKDDADLRRQQDLEEDKWNSEPDDDWGVEGDPK